MSAILAVPPDADCEDLARLHAQSFSQGWSAASIRNSLAQPGAFALAASVSADRGGFILVRVAADEAEILTLAVSPSMRRKGLGAALVRRGAERAYGDGARAIFLEVAKSNVAARALYEQLGFTCIGARRSYYRDAPGAEPEDAYAMRASLPLSAIGKSPGNWLDCRSMTGRSEDR